jgi:siroheme synthase
VSEMEKAVRSITIEHLEAATRQSIAAGVDPGITLAHMAATIIGTLRTFGVTREKIAELVAVSDEAVLAHQLASTAPAGNA